MFFDTVTGMNVRVRMAPSPTGLLHIGTARTALFNWLFAKRNGGALALRIEDTDRERSKKEYEEDIVEQLRWLGIRWEGEPVRQSERTDIYAGHLERLLAEQKAYWCECTKEKLDAERQSMMAEGRPPRYGGSCRDKKLAAGEGRVIRFVMPEEKISFTDMIRGHIEFNTALIGDMVIAKNLREPLYNFAAVIDDADMRITHVIRGEDGIANTPKQIELQKALGFAHPHYAHAPLILDADRSKMSKRNAATAIAEYRAAGYLPDAMINFLALLGWHPQSNKEFFSREELIHEFDITRVQKGGAVFALEKLNWINAHYLRALPDAEIARLLGWAGDGTQEAAVRLVKNRAETVRDVAALSGFIFALPEYGKELLRWKGMDDAAVAASLATSRELIASGNMQGVAAAAETHGRGEIYWPLRAALSGQKESPPPLEIAEVLGIAESVRRIDIALAKLHA
jgi:glutamyl-tRNA synthetase